jgi:predicted enzyme related to lactoylglutathione lyase
MSVRALINIDVEDVEPAIRFYAEAFGLRIGRRFGRAAVELLGAETPIYLLRKAPGSKAVPGAAAKRTYDRHWTPVHLDFVVEDLESAAKRAVAAGATQEGTADTYDWGQIAYFADPFGHGFCLLQFSAAGYDAIATS